MNLTLRAIEHDDLPLLKKWRNHPSVHPYVREFRFLSAWDQDNWFESYQKARHAVDWGQEIMIVSDPKGPKALAVGGFTRVQWRNRLAEFTFYPGPSIMDQSELITEAIKTLLDFGGKTLGLHKITWPVYSHDPRLELYKQIFNVEAILKEEYFWDDKYHDRIYLSKFH